MTDLKFSFGNKKMAHLASYLGIAKKAVATFDLPAGYTCPAADKCLAYANRFNGKLTDGKNQIFRCYAASGEAAFTKTRELRWFNYDTLLGKSTDEMTDLINNSIPKGVKVIRLHSSGDFFSFEYFQAWFNVALKNPRISFFGYTKVLPYVGFPKPKNFNLVYSFGGKFDALLNNEPTCYVVKNLDGVSASDTVACSNNPSDDYDYILKGKTFMLALHGTQPAKGKLKLALDTE